MIVAIFTPSKLIATRQIELIAETNSSIAFLHALNYPKSMDILYKYNVDTVLVNLKFACFNNFELLKQIKAFNKKTVVIILFGLKNEQSLEKCTTLGADYVLDEYVEFEKIPGIVNRTAIAS